MKNQKGITLIALIITIIVLAILAAVSISALTGQNGVVKETLQTSEDAMIAEEKENITTAYMLSSMNNNGYGAKIKDLQAELNNAVGEGKTEVIAEDGKLKVKFVESGRTYIAGDIYAGGTELDWDAILDNANRKPNDYKYSSDTVSEYIAIGTDGNPVDMDLWNPTLNSDGTWLLGSSSEYYESTNAYVGEIIGDGEIEGCVPQYIYNETKGEFTPVTKMRSTFFNKEDLIIPPTIPMTVTDTTFCFGYSGVEDISPALYNITNIGNNMFMNCGGIETLEIPDNIINIGDYAFLNCNNLTDIIIPLSVTSIGYRAFDAYGDINTIIVDEDNTVYDSRQNCNAIIETSTNTLILGCKNTTIVHGITSIGDYAFDRCVGVTTIDIPSTVTSIGSYAYDASIELSTITIPATVVNIGENAFLEINNLEHVYFEHVTAPTFGTKCFYKTLGDVKTTFYFKNSTVADAFTTTHYSSLHGTKSTDYNW